MSSSSLAHRAFLLASAALVLGASVRAQTSPAAPDTAWAPVVSMGQPRGVTPYVAGGAVWDRDAEAAGADFTVGVYRPLVNPIVGVGVALEGTVGWAGGATASGRMLGSLRSLGLQAGAEVRFDDPRVDFVVSVLPPLRRGGPFGQGGALRVDWLPTRGHSLRVGLTVPLGSRWAGEGRRPTVAVALPTPPRDAAALAALTPGAEAALRVAGRNAFWLTAFSYAFRDNSGGDEVAALDAFRADLRLWRDSLGDAAATGFPTFAGAEAAYHRAVDEAFADAVGPALGGDAADAARQALLDGVLLPYDRLLGQPKTHDTLRGLAPAAHAHFGAWLAASGLDASAASRAQSALGALVDIAEANRAWVLRHWDGDERLVWLPLQLALRPEQHDEQVELDALVARAAGRDFTSGNWVLPVNNTAYYRDLITSLHAARDYHVLWVHDFAGHDAIGRPDSVAYTVTTAGYLDALADAVRRYDEVGRIPTFLLLLDEKSYATTGASLWLDLLEDPLGHRVSIPGHAPMEAGVRAAQRTLREAIAGSARFRADAAARGDAWMRDQLKVHVSVTFPSDFSFRSSALVAWMPSWLRILPDELMRDHRKVAFYDLTERDPRRGMALLAGTGVGEQYASPTWEDRGVLTGGPSALALKDAARALLLAQGFAPDEIPPPLRALPFAADYAARVAALDAEGADARALNVHNGVGFAPKQASVAQAVLYTLMPAGCVIYVPDSLWLSSFWAGQLVGASFRGCAVRVIAPSLANAPSASSPVMARSRAIVSRLLAVQNEMQDVFAAAGGDLRVGLYTREAAIDDLPAVLRESQAGTDAAPFLRDEFPFPESVTRLMAELPAQLDAAGFAAQTVVDDVVDRRPKLHRKTQFLALRPVMAEIARQMDVATVRDGLVASATAAAQPDSVSLGARVAAAYPMVSRAARLPPALRDSAVFFTLVGSMNKDDRSLMLDGETLHVVSGAWSLVHYPDFVLLLGRTTWLTEQAQIDALIPPYGAIPRRLSRLIRAVL